MQDAGGEPSLLCYCGGRWQQQVLSLCVSELGVRASTFHTSLFTDLSLCGRTRLLVQGVLKDESGEQLLWALTAVKRLCQDQLPESIFTDADPAAELALNTLFPGCGKYR